MAQNLPTLTLVTPTRNQGQYIEATIRSVLAQNYPNLEYIVMDGGSTDATLSILQRYDADLTHWVSEPDAGQADAINKGFAMGNGEIMGWLNSDDLLLEGALHSIGSYFQQHPNADLLTGLRRVMDAQGDFVRNEFFWMPETDVIRRGAFIAQETTFWRRRLWDDIGTLDTSFHFAMDYEYWQRALAAGYAFAWLPAYLGAYRMHDDAKSTIATDRRTAELARIYQMHGIAQDEDEAFAQLNAILAPAWRHKLRMFKEFGTKRVSHNPRNVQRFFALLNAPVIGQLLVNMHRLYNRVRQRPTY